MTGVGGSTVAVVGAGASGTLVALHLLDDARRLGLGLRLVLVDRSGRFGPGVAYSTPDPHHLLNTPAGKLNARHGDERHFVRWAAARGLGSDPGAFHPREVYGRYLTDTLRRAIADAAPRVRVEHHADVVSELVPDIDGGTLRLASGRTISAVSVVLALGAGVASPPVPGLPTESPRCITDPWQEGALDRIDDGSPVLVVGTGLTMVDVALSLSRSSASGTVHAVSRHGLLPRPHRDEAGAIDGPPEVPQARTLAGLLRQVRRRMAAEPGGWQAVLDELRPHVPELWQRLDLDERRRFLERFGRYWDVHRHRVAPAVDERMTELRRAGRVHVHAGHVLGVRGQGGGFSVQMATRDGHRELGVGWIVNATGFADSLGGRPDPLVRRLLADEVASTDPLGLGLDTGDDGRVLSVDGPHPWLFAVGALRRGTLFESTAVPEIRAQAASLARLALTPPRLRGGPEPTRAAGGPDTVGAVTRPAPVSGPTTSVHHRPWEQR